MRSRGAPLRVVGEAGDGVPVPGSPAPKFAGDIYAADRARIAKTDWEALHIRGDRSAPISLPDRIRRKVLGAAVRVFRGGDPL